MGREARGAAEIVKWRRDCEGEAADNEGATKERSARRHQRRRVKISLF